MKTQDFPVPWSPEWFRNGEESRSPCLTWGEIRTPMAIAPRKAARTVAWRANVAPLVCSIQRPSTSRVPWRRTQPTTSARAGAYAIRALRRSPRPNLLVVQMIGRLANRCAVEDRPSGWRDPGRYRDGPCRHATTIETFRAGPNMNRRIAIVGDRLSDGGTVNANVGPPLSVVSISGTKARSRLRSWPPGSDEDWFPDLSNSKEILFRDMK